MMAISLKLLTAQIHLYKILLGFFASVDLSLIFSPEDPGDHAELRHQFVKIRLVFHTPYL